MMNLNTARTWQASSVDAARLAAAISVVFRKSDVKHGALMYERADGHYMHETKCADVPSHIHSQALHFTERNKHPGLLLGKKRHTPIAISAENPEIAAYRDVWEIAHALKEEGFLSLYYLPIRDPSGRLHVLGIGSHKRKISDTELRLIHSYCLNALESVVTEMQTDLIVKSVLTPRERECLVLAARGLTEKQSAKMLSISHFTVHEHIENCKRKLGAPNKLNAIIKGLQLGDLMPADVETN